jgi:sec-independent protein translocase protein TatA
MPIGAPELIVVLIIALLVLGPKKLPQAGQSLGRGMREFKDSLNGERRDETPEPIAPVSTERAA